MEKNSKEKIKKVRKIILILLFVFFIIVTFFISYKLYIFTLVNKVYDGVKVLGNLKPEEKFDKKYTVKATKFSKSAKEAIEAAGGTVEVI